MHQKDHALLVATESRDSDRLRPQFGNAGMLPSRVLIAQTLHEGPEHMLYDGVNRAGN